MKKFQRDDLHLSRLDKMKKKDNWEKEFDRKYMDTRGTDTIVVGLSELKSFIRSLLHQARQEGIEEVVREIKGMKKDAMSASEGSSFELSNNKNYDTNLWHRLKGCHNPTWIAADIYNQAVDELDAKISELKKKEGIK